MDFLKNLKPLCKKNGKIILITGSAVAVVTFGVIYVHKGIVKFQKRMIDKFEKIEETITESSDQDKNK